ncbi:MULTISPECIES: peptidase inhibitor family I36 protein [unclassified Amycolatopsis]|uniref:peptidase inhibitor family I36 protein n=1 Tax=unclassified Amycolatopsis TaxID=2618356 RepID=UPI002E114955|nr:MULTISPECIES: peptidase inhibitor family I36 protein [unclassified Amycolatopsis]WSK83628.1 peptidase inhibitor family I36 protein [Amycolatopsis sp. NBC_01286]
MMSKVRKIAIGAVLAAAGLIAAPAAQAATVSPAASAACPSAYFCFYFNSGNAGAHGDYFYSDGNLGDELFNKVGTTSNGLGVQVKNHAASVTNNWSYTATVYYNSGCNGSVASQSFAPYSSGNFNATMKNQNASFRWPGSAGASSDCANRDQF